MTKEELIQFLKEKELTEGQIAEIQSFVDEEISEIHKMEMINQRIELIFKKISEIINSDGVKMIALGIKQMREARNQIELEALKEKNQASIKHKENEFRSLTDARTFLRFRYWQDIIMVGIICSAVGAMTAFGKLSDSTAGTLMGAVIGYALGRFKNSAKDN